MMRKRRRKEEEEAVREKRAEHGGRSRPPSYREKRDNPKAGAGDVLPGFSGSLFPWERRVVPRYGSLPYSRVPWCWREGRGRERERGEQRQSMHSSTCLLCVLQPWQSPKTCPASLCTTLLRPRSRRFRVSHLCPRLLDLPSPPVSALLLPLDESDTRRDRFLEPMEIEDNRAFPDSCRYSTRCYAIEIIADTNERASVISNVGPAYLFIGRCIIPSCLSYFERTN